MAIVKITKGKGLADEDLRVKYLQNIEKNISTDNLKFLSSLATKPSINTALKNPLKRTVLKNNV